MDNSKSKVTFFVILYIITIVCAVLGGWALYNIIAINKPWTLTTTYIDRLTYSREEEQPSVLKVKINSNENNNGQHLYEMQFNSYTDTEGKGIKGFGIQCVGDYVVVNSTQINSNFMLVTLPMLQNKFGPGHLYNNTYVFGDFYLYCTADNGTSYYKLPDEKTDDYLLIDIGGKFYRLTLNEYTYQTDSSILFFNKKVTKTAKYTWFDVFAAVMPSANTDSLKEEYKGYPLDFFDLADYLKIEYQDESGKYWDLEPTTENKNLFSIPVEYTKDGATECKDSMFNIVGYSTTWSLNNDQEVQDFWQAETDHKLTQKNLNYIYYDSYGKKFLTIDAAFSNYLKTVGKINIVIDMNALSNPVAGIDLQYFDFDIDSFVINNVPENFEMLNQDKCSVEITLNRRA